MLAIASSGIAFLLLKGGQPAHKLFQNVFLGQQLLMQTFLNAQLQSYSIRQNSGFA